MTPITVSPRALPRLLARTLTHPMGLAGIALVLAAAVLALLTAAPSDAAPASSRGPSSVVHRDGVGDVESSPEGEDRMTPSPTTRLADIRRVSARLTRDGLVMRARLAAPLPRRDAGIIGSVRTPSRTFDLTWLDYRGETLHSLSTSEGPDVRCRGLRIAFDERRTVVTVRIPARCLGEPDRVRVGFGTIALAPRTGLLHGDDAFRRGLGHDLALSSRITRR